MIITISGSPGSGKSTVAKDVAYKLNFKHYSTGDFMRQLAEERKVDFMEFSKMAESDRGIDEELDQRQILLGREEDDFVIDGRLSYHFIPQSVKVFIDADFDVRAKRIFYDRRGEEHNVTIENTKDHLKVREESEAKRYKEYYNLDPRSKEQYDLVVDSSDLKAAEVVEKIVAFVTEK